MFKVYDKWPEIAKKSYESHGIQIDLSGSINHIIFSGMGGSGALGDILSAILSKTKVHVCVVKGYHLPETVNSDTLVVATSISGNTVETLSVLEAAQKQNCKTIAFSSGGMMEEFCKKNKLLYQKIEQIHSPRASFVVFLYSMLKTLEPILPIRKTDIVESLEELEIQKKNIGSHNLSSNNSAISLAEWINGIPLIYYPWGLQAAAIRFKNSLQENAKIHAMTEDVIEACHNNIVSWESMSNVQPILIEGYDDYYKTKERWNILKEYFDKNGISFKEVSSISGSIISKLITLIYFLDYTSIYKAILRKIDPTPVSSIDFIKKRL
jgi:glucose/mannose-6-phosphate isomerase